MLYILIFFLYSQLMNIGARRPPPRKIIMNVSVNDDIQLKKSENAWKPGLKREVPAEDPEIQKTQVGPSYLIYKHTGTQILQCESPPFSCWKSFNLNLIYITSLCT